MFKLLIISALLIGALGVAVSSTAQQALADRVGPLGEDNVKQGGEGEFYSKEGKEYYYGVDGRTFGDVRSDFASSEPNLIGANTGYYASGECHSKKQSEYCQ